MKTISGEDMLKDTYKSTELRVFRNPFAHQGCWFIAKVSVALFLHIREGLNSDINVDFVAFLSILLIVIKIIGITVWDTQINFLNYVKITKTSTGTEAVEMRLKFVAQAMCRKQFYKNWRAITILSL